MHPILLTLSLGDLRLPIGSYGAMLLLAVIGAALLEIRLYRELRVRPLDAAEAAIALVFSGLAGAKLAGVGIAALLEQRSDAWRAAGIVHGGIFGGIVAAVWVSRRLKLPLLRVFDVSAAPVALGQGIGRIGCFLAGCCYGTPTAGPLGVVFTSEEAHAIAHVPLGVPLFPVQLIDAAVHIVLALVVAWPPARLTRLGPGRLFAVWLIAEGIVRAGMESLRGDAERGSWGVWSTGRTTAALLAIFGLAVLRAARAPRP